MKTFKSIKFLSCIALLFALSITSCDFLDVVPPEQAGLPDATKDYEATESFLYSCYNGVTNPMNYSTIEAASDEWALPPLWNEGMHKYLYGLVHPANVQNVHWRWKNNYYKSIGQCHLFLQELEKAKGVTEEDKVGWKAEVDFLLAYYHMMVLIQYGPCPINDKYISMDTSSSEYPGRSHFDYVTNWIVSKFEEAAKNLPAARHQSSWGRATSTMAKALKARLLVYAASPLWNGSFPFPEWKNTNYETEGYGLELVSHSYDAQKWQRAKQACEEALNFALSQGGHELYTDTEIYDRESLSLPFVPGIDRNTSEGQEFLKKVMLMRYLVATRSNEGNKEVIWGLANQGDMLMGSLPHAILTRNNGTEVSGYSGVSPIFNTSISYFYTKDGKKPANDTNFTPKTEWFKSANISGREDIINFNVNREPRFYAWFAFDGGDYGSILANGSPLRIEARNSNKHGFNPAKYNRDNNVTGYFSQKFLIPAFLINKNGNWVNNESKARPLIRLAEVYLNLAECEAALNNTQGALENLNVIRERAGVPALTASDISSDMKLMDWVRNERFVELWGEGHRYYDIRRWMIADKTMEAGKRQGLNSYGVVNPSFEEFNTPTPIQQPFMWSNRMYLLPLHQEEVYSNPQLVQAPGY